LLLEQSKYPVSGELLTLTAKAVPETKMVNAEPMAINWLRDTVIANLWFIGASNR